MSVVWRINVSTIERKVMVDLVIHLIQEKFHTGNIRHLLLRGIMTTHLNLWNPKLRIIILFLVLDSNRLFFLFCEDLFQHLLFNLLLQFFFAHAEKQRHRIVFLLFICLQNGIYVFFFEFEESLLLRDLGVAPIQNSLLISFVKLLGHLLDVAIVSFLSFMHKLVLC